MLNNLLNGDYNGTITCLLIILFIFSQTRTGKNVFTWIRFTIRFILGFKRIEGIKIINVDGSKLRYLMILGALTLLPNNVLTLMREKGLTLEYSKDRAVYGEGDFSGCYTPNQNSIFIWDDGFAGSWGWQVTTTIHEVGHFIDFSVGYNRFLSLTDRRLHNIHAGEHDYYKKHASGEYYTKNICEYFAQGFAEYFLVENFKTHCPDTASYMEGILQSI